MSDDNVRAIDEYTATITSAAKEFGVAHRTLKRRVDEAGLEPAGTLRGASVYRIAELAATLYAGDVPNAPADFDSLTPTDRRAWFESEKLRLSVEAELSGLVSEEDANRERDRLARLLIENLDRAERELSATGFLDADAQAVVARQFEPHREALRTHLIPDEGDE